jgi:hypothetical protein
MFSSLSFAADHYVRDGGSCSSNCNSWTNASDQITTALANAARGDTIWVADGSYNSITLDKAASGGASITIKKATTSSHGTNTGWSSAYGDGQAVISDVIAVTNDWVIDGQVRNESNWSDTNAYGFRITGSVYANTLSFGAGSSNLTCRYVDVGGTPGSGYSSSIPTSGFYLGGFGSVLSNWTISRSHVHNVKLPFQIAGASNVTIEYSWLGPNWNKETIRGQVRASNITIRHNIMKDGCQGMPDDPTAGACTAQIAMWDGGSGAFDGSKIYGNLIWTTKSTFHSDACIMIGGDGGSTAAGAAANNVLVYNNTFVGVQSGTCSIRFPGSHSGDVAQNNIWYGLGSGVSTGCSANTCSSNATITSSNTFVNATAGDFRLRSATAAGVVLSSPYNVDLTGATRGTDGVWDLGAYEYVSGGTPPPPTDTSAPVISSVTSSGITTSGATITWTTNEPADSLVRYGTTTSYGSQSAQGTASITSHSVTLSGLLAGTLYHYRVESKDAAGNLASSGDLTFTTQTVVPPPPPPPAQTSFYIRDGGTSSVCTDWTNACDTLPASLNRGATYYIADGSYGSYTFDDAASGSTLIKIKKATAADHGTNTGWSNAYGDGVANFTDWSITTSHWEFDGQTGQWAPDLPGYVPYGIRILRTATASGSRQISIGGWGNELTNMTFRHIEAAFTNAPGGGTWATSMDVVWSRATNVSMQYCWLHDGGRVIILTTSGMSGVVVEHSVLERNGQAQIAMGYSPDEHSEIYAIHDNVNNVTIRWSHIRDWTSTGGIILFGSNSNFQFYGNVMSQPSYSTTFDANGAVNGLTTGSGSDAYVYNNTFVDIPHHPDILTMGGFNVRETRNNLFFNVKNSNGSGVNIGGTRSHNWFYESGTQSETSIQNGAGDPFSNRAVKDYRLTLGTSAGVTLLSPYDVDMNGEVRGGDGSWDRGAFERAGAPQSTPPLPPTNLTTLVQ